MTHDIRLALSRITFLMLLVTSACAGDGPADERAAMPVTSTVRTIEDTYASARELPVRLLGQVCFGRDDAACDFKEIRHATFKRNGNFLVADGDWTVRELDVNSRLVRTFGRRGAGPGEMRIVGGVSETADGGVAVIDVVGFRVVEFDSIGVHRRTHNGTFMPGAVDVRVGDWSYAVLTIPSGDSVRSEVSARIHRWTLAGDSGVIASFPASAVARAGSPFIAFAAPFEAGIRWDFEGDSTAVVATETDFSFVIFRNGTPRVRVHSDVPPTPVTAAALDTLAALMRNPGGRPSTAPGYNEQVDVVLRNAKSIRPSITALRVTRAGQVWVRSVTPVHRDDGTFKSRWDVFSTDGARAGYVLLPPEATFLDGDRDRVTILEQDEAGREFLSLYRVGPRARHVNVCARQVSHA